MSNFLADTTVLLPYDFSDASAAAIDEALGMVDASTRVHVVHVLVPLTVVSLEPGVIVDLGSDEMRQDTATNTMKERINDEVHQIEFACRIGDPGTEIVAHARDIGANMIIMPSHGRTGLGRLLLGSVAERVLRLAECPVLVLRHAKSD